VWGLSGYLLDLMVLVLPRRRPVDSAVDV